MADNDEESKNDAVEDDALGNEDVAMEPKLDEVRRLLPHYMLSLDYSVAV